MAKKKAVETVARILVARNDIPAIEFDNGDFVRYDSFEEFQKALDADNKISELEEA
jgi:hypothetical protein